MVLLIFREHTILRALMFLPTPIYQHHAPLPLRDGTCAYACPIMWCALPHRGYTFDSAGLASATQPTLGNNASEEATPLGVVLFLLAHHYHTRRMDYSRMISGVWLILQAEKCHGIRHILMFRPFKLPSALN